MKLLEILKQIGFTEDTIIRCESAGYIKKTKNDYEIVNGEFLIQIITKLLESKVDPYQLFIPVENAELKNLTKVFYAFLIDNSYYLAADTLERVYKICPSKQVKLIMDTLKTYPDYIEYILDNQAYGKDEATVNGLKKIERRLLIDLALGDYEAAQDSFELIENIYQDKLTDFVAICEELFRIIYELDMDQISSKNVDTVFYGDSMDVLVNLLTFDDIYRADELIEQELKDNHYSLSWRVFAFLMEQILYINEKNVKNTKLRVLQQASITPDDPYAYIQNAVPRFSIDDLKYINDGVKEDDTDYYQKYESLLFDEGNYEEAKDALNTFTKNAYVNLQITNVDYLFDELDILIKNKEAGCDMKSYQISLKRAIVFLEDDDYERAYNELAKCHNLLLVPNPRIECMLGKYYLTEGDLDKATKCFNIATKTNINPDSIEDMMELSLRKKEYKNVITLFNKYESYLPYRNPRVHYMASSAYLELGKFNDAKTQLQICTDILDADENLPVQYIDEFQTIALREQGYNNTFGVDDYIDYTFTEEEYLISYYIEENYFEANELIFNLNDDIENYYENITYILSVIKSLLQACEYELALELCQGLEREVDIELLEPEEAKVYKKMIKNFKLD